MTHYERFSVVKVGNYVYIFESQDMADAFATCLDGHSIEHCEPIYAKYFKKVHVADFLNMLESDEGHGNDDTHGSDGPP
ncbi:hypothetical protein D9M09_14950 [Janthinobacterium agaricidamnosum]|uniref:Uncharacterized protein n=1 Tax=Janthinobacterium agaricidamnosum TaxID=55508 RepID=A0A3G2E9N3_9BURK|nr:hypothetical protein D9M09_14950 [Janthinobacterium agaricidamnosum]